MEEYVPVSCSSASRLDVGDVIIISCLFTIPFDVPFGISDINLYADVYGFTLPLDSDGNSISGVSIDLYADMPTVFLIVAWPEASVSVFPRTDYTLYDNGPIITGKVRRVSVTPPETVPIFYPGDNVTVEVTLSIPQGRFAFDTRLNITAFNLPIAWTGKIDIYPVDADSPLFELNHNDDDETRDAFWYWYAQNARNSYNIAADCVTPLWDSPIAYDTLFVPMLQLYNPSNISQQLRVIAHGTAYCRRAIDTDSWVIGPYNTSGVCCFCGITVLANSCKVVLCCVMCVWFVLQV